eukprot:XP_003730488.1 PREDICTED: acylglycerol kinase, mitochondrial [Strongylocentrotus purpuratus]
MKRSFLQEIFRQMNKKKKKKEGVKSYENSWWTSKFWYFGPLKYRFSYLWAGLTKVFPAQVKGHASYGHPKEIPEPVVPEKLWWWTRLVNRLWPKQVEPEPEVQEVEEEILEELDISTVELCIMTDNSGSKREGPPALQLRVGPQELSRTDFVKEGWSRASKQDHIETFKVTDIPAGEIHLKPDLVEAEEAWYTIDNDRFEAMPIVIELLPSKLRFFTDALPQATQLNTTTR